ncbi:MAG: DUF805 domain-containing protein [Rhodopseudomonas sp.]|uniref:DUF805 domain-containing protein n=1 Tax=Rhodopseudomonas sp. TaxID=1078 RepID=UPI001816BB94|nr:DUF805 domain-containing protein [Rhodopseudomonas sp.]NVN85543.1 DUF805 domain-containing protein [Rhodopseudomonas sp.]
MDWTNLLFSFNGRINRGKYWLAILIYSIAWTVFAVVLFAWLGGVNPDNLFSLAGGALGLWAAGLVLTVGCTWSGLATGIKRLHDRDKSGWWILLFWFGPSLLSGSNGAMSDMQGSIVLSLIGSVIAIWGFIELGCLRGTSGSNQYGPDPLAPAMQAARP